MAGLTQRLPLEQALYNTDLVGRTIPISAIQSYSPTWTVSNASISYSMDDYFINNVYVMRIQPLLSSEPVVIELDISDSFDADDAGAIFVAHAQFKSNKPEYSTSFQISNSVDDSNDTLNQYPTSTSNIALDKNHIGGLWSVSRSNVMTAPINSDAATYSLKITIHNHSGNLVLMTSPSLVWDDAWKANYAVPLSEFEL